MSYLVHHAGRQEGPYSPETICAHLSAGRLAPTDLCWSEGLENWIPIREIEELSRHPAPAAVAATSPPPLPPPIPTVRLPGPRTEKAAPGSSKSALAASFARKTGRALAFLMQRVLEKSFFMTVLTQRQLQRKKIEMIDLRDADCRSGRRAYEQGLLTPEDGRIGIELGYLAQRQEKFAAAGPSPAAAAGWRKVLAVPARAWARFRWWRIERRRDRLFEKIGRKLRAHPELAPALSPEITAARLQSDRLKAYDAEIGKLATKTRWWERAVGLIVILGLIALLIRFHPPAPVRGNPYAFSPFVVFGRGGTGGDTGTVDESRIASYREVLAGQNKMAVYVTISGDNDFSPSEVQSDVENSLRQAGITILPSSKRTYPQLWVSVDVTTSQEGLNGPYFVIYDVAMKYQRLYSTQLANGGTKDVEATVWQTGAYGLMYAVQSMSIRSDEVGGMTNEFLKDYGEANR